MTGRLRLASPLALSLALALAGCGEAPEPQQVQRPGSSAERTNFINRCVGDVPDKTAAAYVGKTEAEAEALAVSTGEVIRVTGRDGKCIGGDRAYRPERVNVLVLEGQVISAQRG